MKKLFYIKTAFLSLASVAVLSSCLKDNTHFVDFAGSKPLVELPAETGVAGTGELQQVAFSISTTPTPLDLLVNLAAPKPLTTALTVKLGVNAAALTAYNSANGTSYVLLPAADYSSAFTVTIPANTNSVNLVININTSLIDPSQSYALPISITDGGGQQISNYNTVIFNVQVKNAYDDNYTATGYVFHPSAPRAISSTYAVATAGATTCKAPVADLGGSNYYFDFDVVAGGSGVSTLANWVAVGATPAAPSSGFMTADNPAGVAYAAASDGNGLPGGAFYNVNNFNNTYTTATKTFLMHFGYAGGSSSQAGYTRQFYMKLVGQ